MRLSRRALGLVLGGLLLLAAQQLALLHPLAHVGDALHGHAQAETHGPASDAHAQDCALCLATAAVAHLAAAAPAGGPALQQDAAAVVAALPAPPASWVPGGARNRGPPASG